MGRLTSGLRRALGRPVALGAALAVACLTATALLGSIPVSAIAGSPTPYDGELFSLTNQDRASNGLAALAANSTLAAIGQARPYYGCSVSPIYGRAADMLNRDYFAHQIPGCSADGGYVWPIMSADGVNWRSAGENIGWNSGYSDPAAEVNTAFMNSAPHRANILGDYNQLGTGSWYTAGPWNYPDSGSSGYTDVYMFAEEFALVSEYSPPPPPKPTPSSPGGGRAAPTPTPKRSPAPTPAATSKPTPLPTASPRPSRRRRPGVAADFPQSSQGLLSGTIEQVLGGYLDE